LENEQGTAAMTKAEVEQSDGPRGTGQHVLIVEDDPDLREALELIIGSDGYSVASARDGKEALNRLAAGLKPSVIVVDLLMPVMNGWELCEELSLDPNLGSIPVILMSASGGPMLPPRPKSLVRLFRKPFTFLQLLQAIEKGCEESARRN
jgi:CheY-like chemotaxis protein